jgi:SNF2 family DNA or RNA helicase
LRPKKSYPPEKHKTLFVVLLSSSLTMTLSSTGGTNTNGPSSSEQQCRRRYYTVLYYKRSNKVHKHRGTSRQDGILSIAPPPLGSVSLVDQTDDDVAAEEHDDDDSDDDGDEDVAAGKYKRNRKVNKKSKKMPSKNKKSGPAVIYSGVNLELAKRAFLNDTKNCTNTTSADDSKKLTEIQEDEEIALNGQWECQIISQLLEHGDTKKLGEAPQNPQNIMKIGATTQKRAMTTIMNNNNKTTLSSSSSSSLMSKSKNTTLLMKRRAPLHSVKQQKNDVGLSQKKSKLVGGGGLFKAPSATVATNTASLSNAAATAASSSSLATAAGTTATSGKMKKDKNGEWYLDKKPTSSKYEDDEDDNNDDAKAAVAPLPSAPALRKTNIPSSLIRGASSTPTLGAGLMRKRPLGSGGIGGGIMKRSSSSTLPRTMNSATTNSSTTNNATSSTKTANTTTSSPTANNFFPGALGDKINMTNSIREIVRPHQREGIAFLWNCVTGVSPGLNNAIVRAQQQQQQSAVAANSCSSSLSSMGSFDLDDEEMDNSDVEYDDCGGGPSSLQGGGGGGGGGANHNNTKKGNEAMMPKGAVLADEMGLGKTLMTIATIFALHRRQRDRRFIVVCPSSLVSNWAKEFDKWIGKASQPKRVIVRDGNEEGLRKLRSFVPLKPNQSEVLILSYELLRLHVKVICNAAKIGLLVVDEGHRLKNTAGSQTLSALNSITAEARILISGTVIQNNLSEFYTLASFAVPGILGDLNTFRRLYERPMSRANQKDASSDQKEKGRQQSKLLDSITSTFVLRRTQKDVLKSILPPRKEILLFCRPTERQCQLYNSISNRASKSIGSIGGIEASNNPLMLLTEARKLCTHPSLLGDSEEDSSLELSGKMIILSSLLDSIRQTHPTDKVVIISNFTSALTVIEDSILRKKNLPFVRLDGSTDNASRGPLVDSFNNRSIDHSFAFMLSSKAGGCGLNLIGANRLIMVDADYNPATDHQSMARIYRQGQTKPCFVYRLFTTGTVEEVIYQRQIQKGNLAKIANDGGSKKASSANASFTKEELRDCFTLKEGCKCDTKKKLGNKWSDYNGADSLRNHGCFDEPLLGICEDKADTLSFVHLVDDDDDANPADLDDDDGKKEASDVDDDSSLGLGSESSSEEEEFDG